MQQNMTDPMFLGTSRTKQFKPNVRSLLFSLVLSGCATQAMATNYTMTHLSSVSTPGGLATKGMPTGVAINNKGVVLGSAYPQGAGVIAADVLAYDSIIDKVTTFASANGNFTYGNDVNAAGQSIISSFVVPNTKNNMWASLRNADGTEVTIPPLLGDSSIRGSAMNDQGQVTGNSSLTSLPGVSIQNSHVFIWSQNGGTQPLGSLTANGTSRALDINASGQVVGDSASGSANCYPTHGHAFVSTPTGLKDLHSPNMPMSVNSNVTCGSSVANKINDNGMAVGGYTYSWAVRASSTGPARVMHAAVWDTVTDAFTDLSFSTPNSRTSQVLTSINASGQVGGNEVTYTGLTTTYGNVPSTVLYSERALIGDINGGGLKYLDDVYTNRPTGWAVERVIDINDAGQILATARNGTLQKNLVLLTPVSAPTAPSLR